MIRRRSLFFCTSSRIARRCDATVLLARDPWHDGLPLRGLRRMRDAESGRSRLMYFGARERARFAAAVHARAAALHERFARAEAWFNRHGTMAVFLGRLTPLVC